MKILPNGYDLSDLEVKYLEDRLLDIEDWVVKAIIGQIDHAKGEFLKRGKDLLEKDPSVTMIPKDESVVTGMVLNHPNYKNRRVRDEEEKLKFGPK